MDVARYAESVTLRGLVFKEAWRYRDYLVNSFGQDRPFDQMIREQDRRRSFAIRRFK